jgi:hypothetical protein
MNNNVRKYPPKSNNLVLPDTYEDADLTHQSLTLVCFGITAISYTLMWILTIGPYMNYPDT